MTERMRSIMAVAVLTIAIWVWADLEQTGEGEDRVPVQITVPTDYVLRSVTPEYVLATYKGPLGEIQDLKASADRACRFVLTENELKGNRLTLRARDGFKHWAERRVVVTDVRDDRDDIPDGEIHVAVDHLVRVKVRVEPKVTGAVATVATAQPADVTARVAESELKALPEARRVAVATLAVSTIPQSLQVEREVPLDLHLGGPDGVEVKEFDPPIVKVTARLESTVVTKSLGRFPIFISGPPDMLNRYRIVFQPGTEQWVELEVQGPAPDIERLSPQDLRVQLVLTAADKPDPDSWLPGKPAVVGLPPSVKLAKPLPTINFNLEKLGDKPAAP